MCSMDKRIKTAKNQNFVTKGQFGLVFILTAFPWAASSKILYNIAQCLTETLFLVPVMRVMDGFGRNLTEQGRRQKQIRKILEFNPKNLCNFTAWIFMIFFWRFLSVLQSRLQPWDRLWGERVERETVWLEEFMFYLKTFVFEYKELCTNYISFC